MTNSKLTREHSLALLHKLATDDGYRSRYEQNPTNAMTEVGIPAETVANFASTCVTSGKLADKDKFAAAHKKLLDASADCCVQMFIPDPRLNFGDQ
ncbi:MAG TPA: NHLP-related RiPP peptide [Rhodanobacteraceae bacterium]